MSSTSRREFVKSAAAVPAIGLARSSPNETVNLAVVGFHGRGRAHYRAFAKIPNVRVAALCDADERLFPNAVAEVEKLAGYRPATEFDIRKLLERKDIDAVSIATPDYWHALMTIWACQAGKDVYVEKPVSFTVVEGRRMVEAARKYRRIVQAGQNMRSEARARAAVRLLNEGKLGKVYRAKVDITKPRGSIGRVQESSIPEGVHWDLYLGPTPFRPFNLNRFHYGWHFFMDTSTTDVGNSGVHNLDLARWGMNTRRAPHQDPQHGRPLRLGFRPGDAQLPDRHVRIRRRHGHRLRALQPLRSAFGSLERVLHLGGLSHDRRELESRPRRVRAPGR